jgi:hypothetical protein
MRRQPIKEVSGLSSCIVNHHTLAKLERSPLKLVFLPDCQCLEVDLLLQNFVVELQ